MLKYEGLQRIFYGAILIISLSVNFPGGTQSLECYQIPVLHRLGPPRADSEMFRVQEVYEGLTPVESQGRKLN